MLSINNATGYQASRYQEIFGDTSAIVLKGGGPQPSREFDNTTNRYGTTIVGQRIEVYFKGLGTQVVKLPANFKFPKGMPDLAEVILVHPEACQIRRKVYVRAESLQIKTAPRGETNE